MVTVPFICSSITSVETLSGLSGWNHVKGLCDKLTCVAASSEIATKTKLESSTALVCFTGMRAKFFINSSILPTVTLGFGVSLVILNKEGSSVKVRTKETITPNEAKIPRSEMGATSDPAKDPTPIAVVMEVMAMAKPE